MLQLTRWDDPLLSERMPEIDAFNDETVRLANDLIAAMWREGGIGLAANQVGVRARLFTVRSSPNLACFNPRIIDQSREEIELEEGCLTYPGVVVKVKRPKVVKVRFQTPTGQTSNMTLDGIGSRIFQHELDHLNGLSLLSRLTRLSRDVAQRRWQKILKRTGNQPYGPARPGEPPSYRLRLRDPEPEIKILSNEPAKKFDFQPTQVPDFITIKTG